MPRLRYLSIATLLAGAFAPVYAYAQGASFFGPIIPQEGFCACPGSAPDWGCVLGVVQNVFNASLSIAVLVLVLAIAYAGFVFMTSGANPGAREEGRNVLLNAVIGLIVMFGAWLGVDFVMKAVYDPAAVYSGDIKIGPWHTIWSATGDDMCIDERIPGAVTSGTVAVVFRPAGGAPGVGGGTCSPPENQNNPCSVGRLLETCFASRAQDASKICMVESGGGRTSVRSGSDRLNSGSGESYSWGLWQINLTVHKVGSLDCPAAFTNAAGTASRCECGGSNLLSRPIGACKCRIKLDAVSQKLYQQCTQAAQDPEQNMAVACRLYNQPAPNGGFQPWFHTATRVCRVPLR